MERAIALARQCKSEPGRVSPKVGAVVARDGVVLGEAFRGELAPGDHAEFTLLETKLGDATLAGSTLFTTLEPCTMRNDPKLPCADRIIERRLRRVVIGILDPNDAILGRGVQRLRQAGIDVQSFDPDLMAEIEELNRDFARLHARHASSSPLRAPETSVRAGTAGVDPRVLRESIAAVCSIPSARDRILGTGFVADDLGHVLTATQVVLRVPERSPSDPLNLKIKRADGSSSTTPVVWHSGGNVGAAVLRSALVGRPLPISSRIPTLHEELTIFGINAQSGDPDVVVAQVEVVRPNRSITLSRLAMRPGYEGGPVIDRSGAVVGMLWQTRDDRGQELKPVVVPGTKLLYALERARHPN